MSRTHDKLGAALARFASIAGAVRGARVLDVTASTPGYTPVLLERGAEHVGTIAVGPSQLAPRLRSDPRVSVAERVQLKNLPSTAVPGPYTFFTVDVRFISARTALRAIAFRLAVPAHGIVWLKPEFEVPAEQVKSGGLSGTPLRSHALALFREKATSSGFEVVEAVDVPSPPSGDDDGEAEILIQLRYRGRG